MKPITYRLSCALICAVSVSLTAVGLHAQQAPTRTAPLTDVAKDETIELSPFEVRASTDAGYQATETLAGSRMNTSLKDVATQLQVMTPEFLQDLGIANLDDAMRYSLNSENSDDIIAVETPNNTALRGTIGYTNTPSRGRSFSPIRFRSNRRLRPA